MTGFHALHMIVGLGLMTTLLVMAIAEPLQAALVHAGRDQRTVLALRRYCLDFPVPAALSDRTHDMDTNMGHTVVPVGTYVWIWLALMTGTFSTYLVAEYVDIGPWNIVVALLIAGTKMTLVIYFFMHVKFDDPLTRLFVGAGFFWLLILLFMTLVDYVSRDWVTFRATGTIIEKAFRCESWR